MGEQGVMAIGSGRWFGFVAGGAVPRRSRPTGSSRPGTRTPGWREPTPATSALEEVAGRWVLELLGLPRRLVVRLRDRLPDGARHRARRRPLPRATAARAGTSPRTGSPARRRSASLVGAQRHVTVDRALRLLGIGTRRSRRSPADGAGPHARRARSRAALAGVDGPTIVCAQAGEVNTGAFDRSRRDRRRRRGRRRLAPRRRRVRALGRREPGASRTSWPARARRLLGDRRPQVAQRALRLRHRASARTPTPTRRDEIHAAYLVQDDERQAARPGRLGARVLAPRAGLRGLRGAALARPRAAWPTSSTAAAPTRAASPSGSRPATASRSSTTSCSTRCSSGSRTTSARQAILAAVQSEGEAWMSPTTWDGRFTIRISVVGWRTSERDVERTVAAFARAT